MEKKEAIKDLEELRDNIYCLDKMRSQGYREGIMDAIDVVKDIETPVKVTMLKQLEELSDYIPAEIYARKVIEIQKQFL